MKIRVFKLKEVRREDARILYGDEGLVFQPYNWLVSPEGLDDLELFVLSNFFDISVDSEGFETLMEARKEGAEELARRLGHELVFDEEFSDQNNTEAVEAQKTSWERDSFGWTDMRRGSPEYALTKVS